MQAQHINLRNNISSVEESDIFEGCDSHTVADNQLVCHPSPRAHSSANQNHPVLNNTPTAALVCCLAGDHTARTSERITWHS